MHALENRAGAHGTMALARREHEKLGHRRPLDGPGDGVLELPPQVGDGLGLHVIHAYPVDRLIGSQFLRHQELPGFALVG